MAFDNKNNSDHNVEVIEWDFSNIDKSRIRTSKKKVLEQIINYLKFIFHFLIAEPIQSTIY